jgi:hypothetical protein
MEATMSGASLWVLGLLACTAISALPLPSSEMVDPESTRARATRRAELRLTGTVAAFALGAVATTWALGRGQWALVWPIAVALGVATLLIHPWLLVRWVAIPLRMPRLAYTLSRLGGYPWVRDPDGGAVLSGALAIARKAEHDHEAAAWLRDRLRGAPLRGAGIVAAGLLAADAGDRDRARALIASLELLDPDLCPPLARSLAQDWLIADDASDGRWSQIAGTADEMPGVSRTARFFAVAARRIAGIEARSVGTLVHRWLVAPRRIRTAPLLGRALVVRETEPELPRIDPRLVSVLPANDGGAAHVEPVSLHLEATSEPHVHERAVTRIERLGRAWDEAFAGFEMRRRIRERTNALEGWASGELATARLQRDVSFDLAELVSRSGTEDLATAASPRSMLGRAREALYDERLDDVIEACVEAQKRRQPIEVPARLDAWADILEVQARYGALVRIAQPDERRQAFAIVELELRQMAAWFWNDLHERGLANAVSTWLLLEAERVRDHESAAYHRHNIALVV